MRAHLLTAIVSVATFAPVYGAEAEQIFILTERNAAAPRSVQLKSLGSVAGARRVAVPETGGHVLVLTEGGAVFGWGENAAGQLGNGGSDSRDTWSAVQDLEGVSAIAAGAVHSVALKSDGTVWAWGGNHQGQLGDGSLVGRTSPKRINGLSDVTMIAAGSVFTLALRSDGTVWAFGSNWNSIVPGAATRIVGEPTQVRGLDGVDAIAVINERAYAKGRDGRLWAWGSSTEGGTDGALAEVSLSDTGASSALLAAKLNRNSQVATLESAWRGSVVRVRGSSILVVSPRASRHTIPGTLLDVDFGWAVAAISSPSTAVEGADGADLSRASSKEKGRSAAARIGPGGGAPNEAVVATGSIAAAQTHRLVLRTNGTACAVGDNTYGQLGDATAVDRSVPVQVATLTGLSKVATGLRHSLGLKSDGTVWAWGYNGSGQLGDGNTNDKPTPVRSGTLTGIVSVAAGDYHSAAVKNDGTVWAWGYNAYGQLGDGSTTGRTSPVQVILLSGTFSAVAAGDNHTLALRSDGTVWAWGYNGYGQLGDGSTTNRSTAVQVSGLTGVTRIAAAGNFSLALRSDGTVVGWGYNGYGQLGDGSTTSRPFFVAASGLTGVGDIAAGEYHSAAMKNDGTAFTWGYNAYGQLGDASTVNRTTPVQVVTFTGGTAITAGEYFTAALKADGSVWSWGRNNVGQFGSGTLTDSVIPVASAACSNTTYPTVAKSPWTARISASEEHGLAVKVDGTVWGWGRNQFGELGDGTTVQRNSPVQATITGVTQISAGYYHTLALKSDRTVWAWGRNTYGALGNGNNVDRATPIQVPALSGVLEVAAGQWHSLAVKSDGTVVAWGYNGNGRLGDGSQTARSSPVQAVGLSGIISVSAGADHSLALRSDGTVWAWGYNGYGQLGDGTTTQRASAVQVIGLTNVIAISAGAQFSLALRSDGTVWGWGQNNNGELGDGSSSSRTTVVRASDLSGVIAISGGGDHSVALKSDGTVWGWGYNQYGQLGDASTTQRQTPVQVNNFNGGLAVAAGNTHSYALKNDGTIWAWGRNQFGQHGNGTTSDSTVAVTGPGNSPVGYAPAAPGPALLFVPVTPCRIADTRNPNGPFGGPAIPGGGSRNFVIPNSNCGIPNNAAAYSINITVVPQGTLGYLTVWPTGQALPLASTLNSIDGRIKANAAIVPAGASGAVSLFATNTTHAIIDINGYFVPAPNVSALAFYPLTPCRVADTRSPVAPLAGPSLVANQERNFPVRASGCGVPATAQAYSLNFTAVPNGALGYITTWPAGQARPVVSTLNAPTGQVTANAAIVPAGAGGAIGVFATNNTDMIIDINGYFAPAGAGGLSLYNLPPCRVVDTREPGGTPPVSGIQSVNVVGTLCGASATAQAYVFSSTVVPSGLLGYLSLWPQAQPQPLVSTLNALDGAITSNMAIVPTQNGSIHSFVSNPAHYLLDISGYFAP